VKGGTPKDPRQTPKNEGGEEGRDEGAMGKKNARKRGTWEMEEVRHFVVGGRGEGTGYSAGCLSRKKEKKKKKKVKTGGNKWRNI